MRTTHVLTAEVPLLPTPALLLMLGRSMYITHTPKSSNCPLELPMLPRELSWGL